MSRRGTALLFAVCAVLAGGLPALPDARAESAAAPVREPASSEPLLGRWVRPDGGYILEIKAVDAQGVATAFYYNPRPIKVGRSSVTLEGGRSVLVVELRDVNYPGSTYRLTHDPVANRLVGTYFQAVNKETFEVFFERVRP